MELTKEQKLFGAVVSKAWENAEFKQTLINSPEAAVKSVTGESFDLPENVSLKVVDQSNPDHVYFNIPPKPNYEDMELTDDQLELVAGGEFVVTAIIWTLATTVVSGVVSYTVADGEKKSTKAVE